MTKKEFNEKYKDYTKEGFEKYGPLEFDITKATEFLDDIFQDLILIPGFQVIQIKEKFSHSRFYSTLKSKNIQSFIETKLTKFLQL
jgi:hypothetical protein